MHAPLPRHLPNGAATYFTSASAVRTTRPRPYPYVLCAPVTRAVAAIRNHRGFLVHIDNYSMLRNVSTRNVRLTPLMYRGIIMMTVPHDFFPSHFQVIKPELYTEALQYLDGKRRLSNMSREAYSHGSALCDMGLCVMPTPLTHRHDSR
jgi:hypothetical protein